MRIIFFSFLATLVVAILALAQTVSPPKALSIPDTLPRYQTVPPRAGDGTQMWRRAEIHVVPLQLVSQHRATLDSLRAQVSRAETEAMKLNARDLLVREQLSKQIELLHQLLAFAELQDSDRGKGPTALEVQHHLNKIEGQLMCEACHSDVNAQLLGKSR